jgi:hypothetical protein
MGPPSPSQIVAAVLADVLPPGVPPSYRTIVRASRTGRGKAAEITAELVMVDGLPAVVMLRPWAYGWSHRFVSMPGGPLSFEDGAWRRAA